MQVDTVKHAPVDAIPVKHERVLRRGTSWLLPASLGLWAICRYPVTAFLCIVSSTQPVEIVEACTKQLFIRFRREGVHDVFLAAARLSRRAAYSSMMIG